METASRAGGEAPREQYCYHSREETRLLAIVGNDPLQKPTVC